MKPAQTLESRHPIADLEVLKADSALGRVDTVLLGRRIRKHAAQSRRSGNRSRRRLGRAGVGSRGRSVAAVRGDAGRDVRLALGLEVGQEAGRQLAVADGTFVFFCDLAPDRLRLLLLLRTGHGTGAAAGSGARG